VGRGKECIAAGGEGNKTSNFIGRAHHAHHDLTPLPMLRLKFPPKVERKREEIPFEEKRKKNNRRAPGDRPLSISLTLSSNRRIPDPRQRGKNRARGKNPFSTLAAITLFSLSSMSQMLCKEEGGGKEGRCEGGRFLANSNNIFLSPFSLRTMKEGGGRRGKKGHLPEKKGVIGRFNFRLLEGKKEKKIFFGGGKRRERSR